LTFGFRSSFWAAPPPLPFASRPGSTPKNVSSFSFAISCFAIPQALPLLRPALYAPACAFICGAHLSSVPPWLPGGSNLSFECFSGSCPSFLPREFFPDGLCVSPFVSSWPSFLRRPGTLPVFLIPFSSSALLPLSSFLLFRLCGIMTKPVQLPPSRLYDYRSRSNNLGLLDLCVPLSLPPEKVRS